MEWRVESGTGNNVQSSINETDQKEERSNGEDYNGKFWK